MTGKHSISLFFDYAASLIMDSTIDEKYPATGQNSITDGSENGIDSERDWTVQEERKAKRKYDGSAAPSGILCLQQ